MSLRRQVNGIRPLFLGHDAPQPWQVVDVYPAVRLRRLRNVLPSQDTDTNEEAQCPRLIVRINATKEHTAIRATKQKQMSAFFVFRCSRRGRLDRWWTRWRAIVTCQFDTDSTWELDGRAPRTGTPTLAATMIHAIIVIRVWHCTRRHLHRRRRLRIWGDRDAYSRHFMLPTHIHATHNGTTGADSASAHI